MADPMTPKDYIAWVQRSLNRLLSSGLTTNGLDSDKYREQVRKLKSAYGLGDTGEVGPREQDVLVRANAATYEYVSWAQVALFDAGVSSRATPTGIMDPATKTSVRAFQSYEGLPDDGWVGPKTETALIRRCGRLPPGDNSKSSPPPAKNEVITTSIDVHGRVPRLVQRGVTCWAAAFAMMYGWKWGTTSIVQALDSAGADGWYTKRYQHSQYLSEEHMVSLAKALGLKAERVMLTNWVASLRDHGPLMIVQPSIPGYVHWIVVTGIRKTMVFPDRTLDKDELKYNEPGNGTSMMTEAKTLAAEASKALLAYKWFHF